MLTQDDTDQTETVQGNVKYVATEHEMLTQDDTGQTETVPVKEKYVDTDQADTDH
jgi:hypothetical protein